MHVICKAAQILLVHLRMCIRTLSPYLSLTYLLGGSEPYSFYQSQFLGNCSAVKDEKLSPPLSHRDERVSGSSAVGL